MPFQKGHKLAPGGRREGSGPKPNAIKELAKGAANVLEYLKGIEDLAKECDSDKVKLAALIYLTDRVLGKPIARNENLDRAGLAHRSDAELIEMAKTLGLPPPPGIKYDDPHSPPAKAP